MNQRCAQQITFGRSLFIGRKLLRLWLWSTTEVTCGIKGRKPPPTASHASRWPEEERSVYLLKLFIVAVSGQASVKPESTAGMPCTLIGIYYRRDGNSNSVTTTTALAGVSDWLLAASKPQRVWTH